jgi:pimeloyl-ACP methyl ester carboxylesterase
MGDFGYLLIAGGGMSTWVWRDLDPDIRRSAISVDRRFAGTTAHERRHASLDDCVEYAFGLVNEAGYREIVIVAHSGGGVIAPMIAQRLGSRARGIVFVSANIPGDRMNALASLPIGARFVNRVAAWAQVRADSAPLSKFEAPVRRRFCNTASEDVIQYVLSQTLITEPLCVFREKVDWSHLRRLPMTYFRLLRDKTATLDLQSRMAANLAIDDLQDIDGDHMVMLSHPVEFNEALRNAVTRLVNAT